MKTSHFDLKEYIEDNFDYKEQQMNRDQISINCINPDCDDSYRHRKKMTVSIEQQIAHCFACGESYPLVRFIATADGISYGAAVMRIPVTFSVTFNNALKKIIFEKL